MYFIDVLTVRSGVTTDQAYAYFDEACPILARHGFTRLTAYQVNQKMRGHVEVNPSTVQIWHTRSPDGFKSLSADEEYKAIIPERDSIFDMGKRHAGSRRRSAVESVEYRAVQHRTGSSPRWLHDCLVQDLRG